MAVTDTSFEQEAQDRYLTYALSVVTSRALPDVRDGLKPVQRRILYAMLQHLHLKPTGSYRKSAAVIGEVLAKLHPHGDQACYEAMVRLAQDFSLRYPLVDGQGNFGSLDGDGAAAYRYTEARLRELAIDVVGEIEEETVPFVDNFDATVQEPTVLPSRVPNLLINGASGIAVGMATNIPPHNLRDTVKAIVELSENPKVTDDKLASLIKAPDFPTGCAILNTKEELAEIYRTGRGAVRMRGTWEIEEHQRGKYAVIVTSIPYGVNKSQLVEKMGQLVMDRKVPQVVDVRDESTDKVRIVLELANEADAEVAMAYFVKNTPLESNFAVNMTALVPVGETAKPELLSLRVMLQHFIDCREEVVEKSLNFEKRNLLERMHILEGFIIIFDALDEAIKIVRKSDGRLDAAKKLRERFKLSEKQSLAIVDMRIYQLSKTNIDEIRAEMAEKQKRLKEIEKLLGSKSAIAAVVRDELKAMASKYGDNRRSEVVKNFTDVEINEADYLIKEDVFAIVTADGWVKRIRQTNELSGTRLRDGDRIVHAHKLSTADSVVFLTNLGSLYVLKVVDFPASNGYGSPIQKLLKFNDGEMIVNSFALYAEEPEEKDASATVKEGDTLVLVTKRGMGFAFQLEGLDSVKRSGKRAIKLREGDALAAASVMGKVAAFITKKGLGLSFKTSDIPARAQAAVGVLLMGIKPDDELVGCATYDKSAKIKLEFEGGREKEIDSSEITHAHRGLKGNKLGVRGDILRIE